MIDMKGLGSSAARARAHLELVTSPRAAGAIGAREFMGRRVRDEAARDIGRVDGCLVAPGNVGVLVLRIGSGGFLGRGMHESFVPLQLVTATGDELHVASSAERIRQAPRYAPDLVDEIGWLQALYRHFGHRLN